MNNKQLLSRYALKWNPFNQEIPLDGVSTDQTLESFCFRVENLVMARRFCDDYRPGGIWQKRGDAMHGCAARTEVGMESSSDLLMEMTYKLRADHV